MTVEYAMERRASSAGRHPVWVSFLMGLIFGQIMTLITIAQGKPLQGFSGAIPGWEAVLYNVFGVITCTGVLVGMFKQRKSAPIGKFVSGLLIEQYATGSLFMVILIYIVHSLARGTGDFPFLLVFLSFGLVGKVLEIRRELKDIKADLAYAAMVSQRVKVNSRR